MTADSSLPPRQLAERVVADFLKAQRRGDTVAIEDLFSQHPDLAEHIQTLLSASESESGSQPRMDVTAMWDDTRPLGSRPIPGDVTRGFDMDATPVDQAAGRELVPGDLLGEYRIESELGRGGMGVVYRAVHEPSQRRVALKILSPQLPRTQETAARFLSEASLAAAFSHERSTFIYAAGKDPASGHFYIAMELMPGTTLKDVVQSDGPLPIDRAVDYTLDLLSGLEAAHKAGIIHRDVKPGNCFLAADGHVKVGDFGLSKSLVADADLTRTGTFLGTPAFAAPEQIRRAPVDQRTDLFAVAGTLFYLLTGEPPFTGDATAVIAQIVADEPPKLRRKRPDASTLLSRVLERAMQKDPRKRFQTAKQLRLALLPFSSGGSSFADVGRRLAAFFLDVVLVSFIVGMIVWVTVGVATTVAPQSLEWSQMRLVVFYQLFVIPYFALSEGLTGRTLGKLLFNLRVTTTAGERPGLLRGFIRAALVPGITWVIPSVWNTTYMSTRGVFATMADAWQDLSVWDSVIVPNLFMLMRVVLAGIVCVPMRKSNFYRGLHEILSTTRVVTERKPESAMPSVKLPLTLSVVDEDTPASLGSYELIGRIGQIDDVTVYEGRDASLGRRVWLYASQDPDAVAPAANRASLRRPTKAHWLQRGEDGDTHWYAVEAIDGAPLDMARRLPWDVGHRVMSAVAAEVAAAAKDGTLPKHFSTDHIWINDKGDTKIVDRTHINATATTSDEHIASPETSPEQIVKEVVQHCCRARLAPAAALDFSAELAARPVGGDLSTLSRRVNELAQRPYRLRWDDRLGVLVVSFVMESVLYYTLASVITLAILPFQSLTEPAMISLAVMISLIPVAVSAMITKGGVGFRLCGIEVRRNGGTPASPWRLALRNVFAWFPGTFMQPLVIIGIMGSQIMQQGNSTDPEVQFRLMMIGLATANISLINALGAFISILIPQRGLQDQVAGTYLVRK